MNNIYNTEDVAQLIATSDTFDNWDVRLVGNQVIFVSLIPGPLPGQI